MDKTQQVKWFYNDDIEVSVQDDEETKQIYTKEKKNPLDGNTLWILKNTSPFQYVGAYSCANTGTNKTSTINIVITGDLIVGCLSCIDK